MTAASKPKKEQGMGEYFSPTGSYGATLLHPLFQQISPLVRFQLCAKVLELAQQYRKEVIIRKYPLEIHLAMV